MNTDTEQAQNLQKIGRNAYESIVERVAALECDYERLAELRAERADLQSETDNDANVEQDDARAELVWDAENGDELKELTEAAGECENREDAEQRIQEDPLSVEVRSGWVSLGETMVAEDFTILLATGGPAVRVMGELDENKEPHRAWLEVQDWFTPWTQYFGASQGTLLTYARQFYYGE
jgi:hypothetical protein